MIDVSGSTSGAGDTCGDQNADGSPDEIIDCEIQAVIALNDSVISSGPARGSIVAFDSAGQALDVNPAAPGIQTSTDVAADLDGNGTNDITDVARTLVPGGGSDFDAALDALVPLTVSGSTLQVAFFTDGESSLTTGPGSPLQAVADADIVVDTFSIGAAAVPCGADSELQAIADATGGTCTTGIGQAALDGWFTPPPNTTITKGPRRRTRDRTPTFRFTSSQENSTFECSVDGLDYTSCTSPETTVKLKRGKRHTFSVRAINAFGNVDPMPASMPFKVLR